MRSTTSWWEFNQYFDNVDFLIIGAGIVGLSTGIELLTKYPSSKILIIEKSSVPIGASTRNAGFACFGSISEILDDVDTYGSGVVVDLLKLRWDGLNILRERVGDVSLNYQHESGIELFQSSEEFNQYASKIDEVNNLVNDAISIKNTFSLYNSQLGMGIKNNYEGSIYPHLMMDALYKIFIQKGGRVIRGIEVTSIDIELNMVCITNDSIKYNKLILCTNGLTGNILPGLDLKPARNQVFITHPIDGFGLDGCYHFYKGFVYFRCIENRLLIGGGRHLSLEKEATDKLGTTKSIIEYLKSFAEHRILNGKTFEIDQQWGGILGVGSSKLPIVKYHSEHIVLALRMGGMGIAIGSSIGKQVANIL